MKTVLIVEDDERWQNLYKSSLENQITLLSAFSLEEAEKMFFETPNIDLIVIDGCVDNEDTIDSLPLIEKMQLTYKGDIIAASGSSYFRDLMCEVGCNYCSVKGKVADMIKKLLNLN